MVTASLKGTFEILIDCYITGRHDACKKIYLKMSKKDWALFTYYTQYLEPKYSDLFHKLTYYLIKKS